MAQHGNFKFREDIVAGIEQAPQAFVGFLNGHNFGKLIVRLADAPEPAQLLVASGLQLPSQSVANWLFACAVPNGCSHPESVRIDAGNETQTMRITKLLLTIAIVLLANPMPSHAIEEPAYEVTEKIGAVEVREYAPYVVAEVLVPGSATEAGNHGFRILAGYIFGKNKGQKKLAMTAPVTQSVTPMKLAMTAPVMQNTAPGGYLVQFVLPKGVTLVTAPEPIDKMIVVRQVPQTHMAVIRYTGFWSDANYNKHLSQLQETLQRAGKPWLGEPIYSRYNAPFTPWFMRRNEIWLQLPATASNRPS